MIDWSLRHCSRHGHVTYRPDETDLAEGLCATTDLGDVWRCLRCGDFVLGEPAGSGPAAAAPDVPRGRVLRDRLIIRSLAVERAARAVMLFIGAYLVWRLKSNQTRFADWIDTEIPLLKPAADTIGWNIDNSWLARTLREVASMNPGLLTLVIVGLIAYAITQLAEGYGLWHEKRWGEYLAVVATSMFIPLEVWELAHHVTILKIVLFLINVVAVVWLIVSKRLFGARGGYEAFKAEHASESLLTVTRSATVEPS